MKIRTIITQDAEVDDQNSLRHFLFYSNEVDLQGIIQTSSKFHWQGVEGAIRPEDKDFKDKGAPFDKPFRWTGYDWMWNEINDYEKDYPNLIKHSPDYPTPDYLRSIIKLGNIGYVSQMDKSTEGSNLIKERILDDDPRTLYIQVWGGMNTIARALYDIQKEHEGKENWKELHEKISKKVVLTACGEQDTTYRDYICEEWPGIKVVKTLQMGSYAYLWFKMPEGESKDTLRGTFMKSEIMNGKSVLADGYCTWLDGRRYQGEEEKSQFGANPNVLNEWFLAKAGWDIRKYDFLSEGDSPTFFMLFDWGFRSLENFGYGGASGRYEKNLNEYNSKGEALDIWEVAKDEYIDRDGNAVIEESMWPFVADIQRDFAARVDWASKPNYMDGEHKPNLMIQEGVDICAKAGETTTLHALVSTTDATNATVSFKIYKDISIQGCSLVSDGACCEVTIGEGANIGDQLHVIVQAKADGHYQLVHYQHVIITVV